MTTPPTKGELAFGAFRMDLADQRLWHGARPLRLRPKSWEVLRHLVERPGVLVPKDALHRDIWRDAAVTEDVLTQTIGELRRVLGDDARHPSFIETVHRRGFRFIAEVRQESAAAPGQAGASGESARMLPEPGFFVGREHELQQLQECFGRACSGARQLIFVTGEPGIGKTTLVERFLASASAGSDDVVVLFGQCVQQYGPREPYMPVLDAIEGGLRSARGELMRSLLQRLAPGWLGQIPALAPEDGPSANSRPAPPERRLREIGAFLEALSGHATVVLVLEDLHWSDTATAELLSFLGQRRDAARMLLIATYRPADATVGEHPIREVKQLLQQRRRCTHLALGYLSRAEVGDYVTARFGEAAREIATLVHQRTDGNALFVVATIDELIRRGWLTEAGGRWSVTMPGEGVELGVPDDVRAMITANFQRLDERERGVIEVASVAGMTFLPRLVARALGWEEEEVDGLCRRLWQSDRFLHGGERTAHGDGSAMRSYAFAHVLYRQVVYEHIPDVRRQRWHRSIGDVLEAGLGERSADLAAVLSIHFEESGDGARASHYLILCTEQAQRRSAHREAISYARHALEVVDGLPDRAAYRDRELKLRLLLNVSLNVTYGYRSHEVRDNVARARELCVEIGDARQLFEIVHALWYRQGCGAEAEGAWESVAELERIADRLDDAESRWRAKLARGRTHLWSGDFTGAVRLLGELLPEAENPRGAVAAATYGVAPTVAAFTHCAVGWWFLGYPERARRHAREALQRAEHTGEPFDVASAAFFAAWIDLLCGDSTRAGALASRAAAICAECDIAFLSPPSQFVLGAARVERGDADGLDEMRESLARQQSVTGPFFCDVILASLAAAYGRAGRWDEGLGCVDEGLELTAVSLERLYAAELWRIKGELVLGKARAASKAARVSSECAADSAERHLVRAFELAAAQEAGSLALRSAMSLARLYRGTGESRRARVRLESAYASFREGFDTRDLRDARALLEELATAAVG